MKHLFHLLMIFFLIPMAMNGQRVISADKAFLTTSIRLNGQEITVISTDSDFSAATDAEVATRLAIKGYLEANTSTVYIIPTMSDTSTILTPKVSDIAYVSETELAIRGTGPDKWLTFTGGGGKVLSSGYFDIVGYGSSMLGGIEGGPGIPKDTLSNLWSFNNDGNDWNFETAYPSTTLSPGNYTNIPRRRFGDVALHHDNQYIPADDHGGPMYYFGRRWAETYQTDTVRMAFFLNGGNDSEDLTTSPNLDTLQRHIDSLQFNGLQTADVFFWATGPGDQNQQWYENTIELWDILQTAGIVDDRTMFVITGTVVNPDVNNVMATICQGRPSWKYIYGTDEKPTTDGTHWTFQSNFDISELVWNTVVHGSDPVVRDTFGNTIFGPVILPPGSDSNFVATGATILEDDVDSLDNNIIITDVGLNFTGYVRNNILLNRGGMYSGNLSNLQNMIVIGHNNMPLQTTIRDSSTIIGRWNTSTKVANIFGNFNNITHTDVFVYGDGHTSSANFQVLLGKPNSTSFVFGDIEWDYNITPSAGEDGWGWFWNNAAGEFQFSAPPGLGGGSTITLAGDIGTPFSLSDGQTGTFQGINGIEFEAGTATRQMTASLTTTGVTGGQYGGNSVVPRVTVDAYGRLTLVEGVPINHDALTNFVAAEHVDHSAVSIIAGTSMQGGGTIEADRTLNWNPNSLATATIVAGDQLPFVDVSAASAPAKTAIENIDVGLFNDDGTYFAAPSGLTSNYLPYWNGSAFVNTNAFVTGTNSIQFEKTGGPTNNYVDIDGDGAVTIAGREATIPILRINHFDAVPTLDYSFVFGVTSSGVHEIKTGTTNGQIDFRNAASGTLFRINTVSNFLQALEELRLDDVTQDDAMIRLLAIDPANNNVVRWVDKGTISGGGGGDNLGDHTATEDLDMAGFDITSATPFSIDGTTQTTVQAGGTSNRITMTSSGIGRIESSVVQNIESGGSIFNYIDSDNNTTSQTWEVGRDNSGNTGSYHQLLSVTELGVFRINDAYSFPSADGTAGYALTTDGVGSLSFTEITAATPGGSDTELQYNNGESFGGFSPFTVDDINEDITFAPTLDIAVENEYAFTIAPTVNKSTSGDWIGLRINTTEISAPGSNNRLIQTQVGGVARWELGEDGDMILRDGITQIFNPNGTNAGLNVGGHTADPSTGVNGDVYYNSTSNKFRCYENGSWVNCIGAGGGGGDDLGDHTATEALKMAGFNIDDIGVAEFANTGGTGQFNIFQDASANLIIQDDQAGADDFTFTSGGDLTMLGDLTVGAYTLNGIDGTDGQVLTTDGAGNVAFESVSAGTPSMIQAVGTGTQSLTEDTGADVVFDVSDITTGSGATDFTITGGGVECNFTGTVRISGTVNFDITTGSQRADWYVRIQVNDTDEGGNQTFGPFANDVDYVDVALPTILHSVDTAGGDDLIEVEVFYKLSTGSITALVDEANTKLIVERID
jgi:hypothetical protein